MTRHSVNNNTRMGLVKVHSLTFEMELKGKLGQSSVNGLLNNSSSVNPLPMPDIMEVDSLRGKMFQ